MHTATVTYQDMSNCKEIGTWDCGEANSQTLITYFGWESLQQ